jgi:anoctamin-10
MSVLFSDEAQRKELVRKWPFNFLGGTKQPLDDIYSYFGLKVSLRAHGL